MTITVTGATGTSTLNLSPSALSTMQGIASSFAGLSATASPQGTIDAPPSALPSPVSYTTSAAAVDRHFLHVQSVAALTWTVLHNLGKYPAIQILDSSGAPMFAPFSMPDGNTVVINFREPRAGKVVCN